MVTQRTCQRRHPRVPPHIFARVRFAAFGRAPRIAAQAAPRWSASHTAVLSRTPSRTASAQ
ncbi:hypothetical protein GCM10009753_60060 [Streptantibioticus ferralitis]